MEIYYNFMFSIKGFNKIGRPQKIAGNLSDP